ncbi:MAG: hypothetical protein WC707_03425 [Candidatus Babeliaceae bacterium]
MRHFSTFLFLHTFIFAPIINMQENTFILALTNLSDRCITIALRDSDNNFLSTVDTDRNVIKNKLDGFPAYTLPAHAQISTFYIRAINKAQMPLTLYAYKARDSFKPSQKLILGYNDTQKKQYFDIDEIPIQKPKDSGYILMFTETNKPSFSKLSGICTNQTQTDTPQSNLTIGHLQEVASRLDFHIELILERINYDPISIGIEQYWNRDIIKKKLLKKKNK